VEADMTDAQDSGAREGMPETPPDAFALLARWNYSLVAFYVRRFQRQMELPLRLVHAVSPTDLVELRRVFEADLIADYADQAGVLYRACADVADAGEGDAQADYGAQLLKAQQHAAALIEQAKAQAERIIARAEARAAEITAEAEAAGGPSPRRSAAG
jgi:hypothetical protein